MTIGEINKFLKPETPNLFLAKPNGEIISKLSEAYKVSRSEKSFALHELSFRIPFKVFFNNQTEDNHNIELLHERYYIKLTEGNKVRWFVVISVSDVMDEGIDYREVECRSIANELNDKQMNAYSADTYNARQVLSDVLKDTIWNIEYLDADFELTYRSFEFNNVTVLSAVFSICETYNAAIEFDTINRTISLRKPELFGNNEGLTLSYDKYMKTLNHKRDANEIVTRIIPRGKDGLGIERINPMGINQLDDFSFWMYPFERDASRNVIESSRFMSDELCHALLDHNELLDANRTIYSSHLTMLDTLTSQLTQRNTELGELQNQLSTIIPLALSQQLTDKMLFAQLAYTGATYTNTFNWNSLYYSAIAIYIEDGAGKTITVNGQVTPVESGKWFLARKMNAGISSVAVTVSGAGATTGLIQLLQITQDEYNTANNGTAIIEKYSVKNKESQIEAKKVEIENIKAQITATNDAMDDIIDLLSIENNLTPELIKELNPLIVVKAYENGNIINENDLYEEAKKHLNDMKIPQNSFELDIVNFLEVVEEQHNWSKLKLNTLVNVEYKQFNLSIEARIVEINYDYEAGSISLKISFLRHLDDAKRKFEKYIYETKNTTTLVNSNRKEWDKAFVDTGQNAQIINQMWDWVTNEVNMEVSSTVKLDNTGLTIYDPDDPMIFLRGTHSVLAITNDGGLSYKNAITHKGVVAERLYSKIIIGVDLSMGSEDGVWETIGPKTTVYDRFNREAMRIGLVEETPDKFGIVVNRYSSNSSSQNMLNKIILNSEDGFKIQQWNGIEFKDRFMVDNEGYLYSEDMTTKRLKIVSDTNELLLDSFTKFMDIGRFENIITDGKLTAIEKLQLSNERTRIISEYQKLLDQANTYKNTSRDSSIRIDTTNFTNSYNELIAYLAPLLSDMNVTSVIDRAEFEQKFKAYYDEVVNIINAINDSIKYSSVQFGTPFNNVLIDYINGVAVTRNDTMYRSLMNATKGFAIQKNTGTVINPIWVDQFFANTDGVIHAQGINIQGSVFLNGGIEGSSITLRDGMGGVMKLFPSIGFHAGAEDFANAIASIGMDGTAKFKKLIVTNGDGGLMIDSENKFIDMNQWDLRGAAVIVSELISAQIVATEYGFISDLTAGRLSTLTNAAITGWSNYVTAEENSIKWITGRVSGAGTHTKLADGRPLYWVSSTLKGQMTTDVTPYPVMTYPMEEKVKREITFEGSGELAIPIEKIGEGDGGANDSAKVINTKYAGGYKMDYKAANTAKERSIDFRNDGVFLFSEDQEISQIAKDITFGITTGGTLSMKHVNGLEIEFLANGRMKLKSSVAMDFDAPAYNFA